MAATIIESSSGTVRGSFEDGVGEAAWLPIKRQTHIIRVPWAFLPTGSSNSWYKGGLKGGRRAHQVDRGQIWRWSTLFTTIVTTDFFTQSPCEMKVVFLGSLGSPLPRHWKGYKQELAGHPKKVYSFKKFQVQGAWRLFITLYHPILIPVFHNGTECHQLMPPACTRA